jgi:hypothetical protein
MSFGPLVMGGRLDLEMISGCIKINPFMTLVSWSQKT